MPQYIRRCQPGGTYFFTAHLTDRSSTLLTDQIDRLRAATRRTIARYPFQIDAIAVLPSTILTIWTLPKGDANFALRWSMLKSSFSKGLSELEGRKTPQFCRNSNDIWQHQVWEHLIHNRADFDTHLQMIHASPVQSGQCARPQDWPHSSVHRFISLNGDLPAGPDYSATKRHMAPIRARTYREEEFSHHP